MTETNVRTHVSSINKKAKAISGRKLILAERNKGYILNEYM
jgi:DNA-binding response OmpR family regulator